MPESKKRKLAAAGIIAAGACLVAAILIFGVDDQTANGRDFIQYWALEQQLAHHGNPYDPAAILRVERSVGMDKPGVLISLSPPVAFAYALPLGWVSSKTGLTLWMLVSLGCMGLSTFVLWLLHGRPTSRWHVIGLAFPPALWCLIAGQLGIFFLLDIVLFLFFIRRRPWLAGAALVLCALKPHLFLPWALALLLWSVSRRQWGVMGGFAAALAVSCGLTLWVDPRVWGEYAHMMHASRIMDQFLPTVSFCLRLMLDRNAHWIEFVPDAGACLWAALYFLQRRRQWDWNREGMLVLLVSAACTPYCWYSDQAMLFPAVLAGIYAAEKSVAALAVFVAMVGVGFIAFVAQIPMTSAFYIWTAPSWLLWYMYATRKGAGVEAEASGVTAAI